MATKALTAVAQRASRGGVSARKTPAHAQDWREILISRDAQAIWNKLALLVSSTIAESPENIDLITQNLFLFLISTERFDMLIRQGFSSEEIRLDIVSLLTS